MNKTHKIVALVIALLVLGLTASAQDTLADLDKEGKMLEKSKDIQRIMELADKYEDAGNLEKTFYWHKKASDLGSAKGTIMLAMDYYVGKGVEVDKAKALTLVEDLAEKGDTTATFIAGLFNMSINPDRALPYLKKAYSLGETLSALYIGKCYEYGTGVEVDRLTALSWYETSMDSGDSDGEKEFNRLYEELVDEIVEQCRKDGEEAYYAKDFIRAANQFETAAKYTDNASDIYNVGLCYENLNIPETAYEWYRVAADKGLDDAKKELPEITCQAGLLAFEEHDYEEAKEWFKKSSDLGNGEADNCLGYMYQNGIGVGQNNQMALSYYSTGSRRGCERARNNYNNLKRQIEQERLALINQAANQLSELANCIGQIASGNKSGGNVSNNSSYNNNASNGNSGSVGYAPVNRTSNSQRSNCRSCCGTQRCQYCYGGLSKLGVKMTSVFVGKMAPICNVCYGSGVCQKCATIKASSSALCSECNGRRYCTVCKATGYVKNVKCPHCNGKCKCPRCNGRGLK